MVLLHMVTGKSPARTVMDCVLAVQLYIRKTTIIHNTFSHFLCMVEVNLVQCDIIYLTCTHSKIKSYQHNG